MRVFVFIFLIAAGLTAVSIPYVRRFALWAGFVDQPAARKLHGEPIPLMGGLAITLGALLAFLLIFWLLPARPDSPSVLGAVLAAALVALVGLVDDRRGLPAWLKLASQFGGFAILALAGVRVQLPIPEWLNLAITFLWLAGISNAINFLDNMDGLAAGVSGVAAVFILLLAASNDQYLVAALAAAVLGACLGFLRYNFRPATIFMGDAGSLFLGFLLAMLGIQLRFPANVSFVTWMVPVFIMGLPILDTTLVLVSRLRRRVNPFTTAGKDHLSHRLVARGYSQRETVLMLYLLAGLFGIGAMFITTADIVEGYALGFLAALMACLLIWRLEFRGT
ncbi:MAG: glycosyltransferase family 4 protein [Candidatus Promineifilaceae bacterium]